MVIMMDNVVTMKEKKEKEKERKERGGELEEGLGIFFFFLVVIKLVKNKKITMTFCKQVVLDIDFFCH